MLTLPFFWLQECWPADEIIAPMLGLPLEQVRITLGAENQGAIYIARALGPDGHILDEWSFNPVAALRPYMRDDEEEREIYVAANSIHVEQNGESRLNLS